MGLKNIYVYFTILVLISIGIIAIYIPFSQGYNHNIDDIDVDFIIFKSYGHVIECAINECKIPSYFYPDNSGLIIPKNLPSNQEYCIGECVYNYTIFLHKNITTKYITLTQIPN